MMEIRRAVKEDLPQINQLITDHPESFVKVKTAAELHDRNKLLIVAVTKKTGSSVLRKQMNSNQKNGWISDQQEN